MLKWAEIRKRQTSRANGPSVKCIVRTQKNLRFLVAVCGFDTLTNRCERSKGTTGFSEHLNSSLCFWCNPHLWNLSFCLKTIQHRVALIFPYCSSLPELPKNYRCLIQHLDQIKINTSPIDHKQLAQTQISQATFASCTALFVKCWLRVKVLTVQEFHVPRTELHLCDALNVQVSEWFLLLPFSSHPRVPFL